MNALNKLLKPSEWLALATTALVDISKGYPHKEIGGATGPGLSQLIKELVTVLRAQGIKDDGSWDCDATQGIPVCSNHPRTVSAEAFLSMVENAGAYYVGDSPLLMEVSVYPLNGEADNEVIHASWESEEFSFSVTVTEEGLRNVVYDPQKQAYLVIDKEGDELEVKLFNLVEIEPAI